MDKEKIKAAFLAAKTAGLKADPGADHDGGTCNFDTPEFRMKGARATVLEKIAASVGLYVTRRMGGYGSGYFLLGGCSHGQAARRTTMAEAATKALDENGLDASVFYMMD